MDKDVQLNQAQADMRKGYADGSIGVLTSGTMWLIAALVAYFISAEKAIWALLIGGMLINPVSGIIEKLKGYKGHHPQNALKFLAWENTIWMIMMIAVALLLTFQQIEWFFQAMLMIIGGRYLTFQTLYGMKIYWVFGAVLGIAALVSFKFDLGSFETLLTGALIEILFGIYMLRGFLRKNKQI